MGTCADVSGEKIPIWRVGLSPPSGNLHMAVTHDALPSIHKITAEQIAPEEFLDYGVMIINGCLSVFCLISLKNLLKCK